MRPLGADADDRDPRADQRFESLDIGLGSTASALMRDLDVTVLMVRPTEEEQERAKELMIPRYPVVFPYG